MLRYFLLRRRLRRFSMGTKTIHQFNIGILFFILITLLLYRWGPALFDDFEDDRQGWQSVSGTQDKFLVYSAYYIHSNQEIRVIAATILRSKELVKCFLCQHPLRQCTEVNAAIKPISEHWDLHYSASFVRCPIPANVNANMFKFVTVLPNSRENFVPDRVNLIPIQFPADKADHSVEFAVCVPPVHRGYDNVLRFLEWMEFYRVMGVGHFTFYNVSIGPRVSCLMNEIYGNIITVLPWTHPFAPEKNIRGDVALGALNECTYRHRGAAQHVIIVDLDEMIVPERANNYTQLMNQLNEFNNDRGNKFLGAYSAQNAFFFLQYPDHKVNVSFSDDPFVRSIGRQLLLLRKTRRLERLYPHGIRSKYICIPERVMEVGNHFIWEYANGYNSQFSPPELMISHHYRFDDFGGPEGYKTPSVIHGQTTYPFGHSLTLNVAAKLKEFGVKCGVDISQLLSSSRKASEDLMANATDWTKMPEIMAVAAESE